MKIRNIAVAGLMGLASIVPGKAQKPVQFIAETGVTGALHSVPLFYGGMNAAFPKGKNYTDVFAGVGINTNKQASFLGLAVNNYSWTKNISSWAREIFVASDRGLNSTLELSPISSTLKLVMASCCPVVKIFSLIIKVALAFKVALVLRSA